MAAGKISFSTELDSTAKKAKCEKLNVIVKDTCEGVQLQAKFVLPIEQTIQFQSQQGKEKYRSEIGKAKVDLQAQRGSWTLKLDAVDHATKNLDLLKIEFKEKVDNVGTCTIEYKVKGNAVKLALEPVQMIEGVKTKLEFDNQTKNCSVNAAMKVEKADLNVKAEANAKTREFQKATATVSYPLPEGVKASLEVNTKGSGKITLKRGNVTAKLPIDNFSSAPNMDALSLSYSYNLDVASF
jgi:hypothetical protein